MSQISSGVRREAGSAPGPQPKLPPLSSPGRQLMSPVNTEPESSPVPLCAQEQVCASPKEFVYPPGMYFTIKESVAYVLEKQLLCLEFS